MKVQLSHQITIKWR